MLHQELTKTLRSLLENFEFLKNKVRTHVDDVGQMILKEFENIELVVNPIFDGERPLSLSMRGWLESNFPGLLESFENSERKPTHAHPVSGEGGQVEVVCACAKWWYTFGNAEEQTLGFYLAPLVKRNNHRKHNSHLWFFKGLCEGLSTFLYYSFLTDCGTSFDQTCIALLMQDLIISPDIIGVTARQRVETPNGEFQCCQDAPFEWMRGDHSIGTPIEKTACWRCWLTFFTSCATMQAFEMESSQTIGSSMFNLVEALPVMPGPCVMTKWQTMRKFKV